MYWQDRAKRKGVIGMNQPFGLKKMVSDRFSQWAGRYDKSPLQNLVFRHSHNMFVREIEPYAAKRINLLDVGCGTGEFAFNVIGRSYRIKAHGVDISHDMIKVARSKLRSDNIEFKVGDVEELPYEKDTFDIITCSHSFHHYPDQKKALSEMHRILKDDGRLMIIDGSRDKVIGKLIFGAVIKKVEKDIYHVLAREIKEMFHMAGFGSVKQRTFNPLIPLLFTVGTKKA